MKTFLFLTLLGGLTAAGCSSSTTPSTTSQTYNGTAVAVGSGSATSFVKVDASGNPSSVGITFTDSAMSNLGSTDKMYMLDLPTQKSATPFDHIMINWNPNGHPPAGVYDKPHFDMHFFTVDEATQNAVVPGPDKTAFDSTLVPFGYATDHNAVPAMGVHYSMGSDFAPGYNFDKTFIYGAYSGKFFFVEPMITRSYMMNATSNTFAIPQPGKYAYPGKYFPTKYTITHDAAAKTYTVSLDSLVMR